MAGKIDITELMAKVGRIRILTNRLIDDQLSGDYHSTFKGQGVEFDEVRPYEIRDDVRTIDWNVTARTGIPYIKRYSEERELTVLFLVDISGSQGCGGSAKTKSEISAEVAALLALTAIQNQDKVGLILFSDQINQYIPPRKGRDSVMRLAREVLAAGENATGGTDMVAALKYLDNVQKRRAVVFLISDFIDCENAEKMLKTVAKRHDLICIKVTDDAEQTLPDVGLVELEDPETGDMVLVDTSSKSVRDAFAANSQRNIEELHNFFKRNAIETLDVSTGKPYINDIRALFKRRACKRK